MSDGAGYGGAVRMDNSAWARIGLGRVTGGAAERFFTAVRSDEVLVSPPFALEALYSARDARAYRALAEELSALPQAGADAGTWRLAARAQQALADDPAVLHRVKAMDLLIAAIADRSASGVLHYDHDYDVISAHTPLSFRSLWVAERGSLE